MDFSTIRTTIETNVTNAVTYVGTVASGIYNGPVVAAVAKLWETSGPAKYVTAAVPAVVTAYAAHKLLGHNVSFKNETANYIFIKGTALASLIASGMFSAAYAATAFGASGVSLYAAGLFFPSVVVVAAVSR